jgi:DNA-binding transcriptional MerR regulator
MKISELVERTDVPLPTVKFYIRVGLLAPGRATSRTQAEYEEMHVERLALIRVLRETVGLSLDHVRTVLEQVDRPDPDRVTAIGNAMAAIPPYVSARTDHPEVSRLLKSVGWHPAPGHPVMDQLEEAIRACSAAGLPLTTEMTSAYAHAMLEVARIDVALLPENPSDAVRVAVIGTAVGDVLLAALRRLAQLQIVSAPPGPDVSF